MDVVEWCYLHSHAHVYGPRPFQYRRKGWFLLPSLLCRTVNRAGHVCTIYLIDVWRLRLLLADVT